MLYVLLYCMRGSLNWQNAKSDADGARMKANTSEEELCATFSSMWIKLLREVRAYEYEQAPNYEAIRKMLKAIAGSYDPTSAYGWSTQTSKKSSTASRQRKLEPKDSDSSPPKRSKRGTVRDRELETNGKIDLIILFCRKKQVSRAPQRRRKVLRLKLLKLALKMNQSKSLSNDPARSPPERHLRYELT